MLRERRKADDINSFRARWYVQRGGKVQLTDNYRARERTVLLMIHIQTKIPDRWIQRRRAAADSEYAVKRSVLRSLFLRSCVHVCRVNKKNRTHRSQGSKEVGNVMLDSSRSKTVRPDP